MIQCSHIMVHNLSIDVLRRLIRSCMLEQYDIQIPCNRVDVVEGEDSDVSEAMSWYEFWTDSKYEFTLSVQRDGCRFVDAYRFFYKEDGQGVVFAERGLWGVIPEQQETILFLTLLRRLLLEGYGSLDNNLLCSDKPLYYGVDDVELLQNIITHQMIYELPIIYVSCGYKEYVYHLDVNAMAQAMAGLAHVVVETTPQLSQILREPCDGKNPYRGGIGIFYPSGKRTILLRSAYDSGRDFFCAVCNKVLGVCEQSWQNISMTLWREHFQRTLDCEKEKSDETLLLCDGLLQEKDSEIEHLQKQVEDLKSELFVSQSKTEMLESLLLNKRGNVAGNLSLMTSEMDLYPGEQKDVLLKLIRKERDALAGDYRTGKSRKYHVLSSLCELNKLTGEDERIKNAFSVATQDGTVSLGMIKELERYGFHVEKTHANHYKITFMNDDRYQIGMSFTPSDRRAGENLFTAFMNLIFGY